MIDIDESDFRRFDLNLLLVFSALLRERSVTKAAGRLFIGQPALSAALARLREFAGDELFVRTAQGMQPTNRALRWAETLKPLLEGLGEALFELPAFDPATSERTFVIGLSDILEMVLAPGLLAALATRAPRLRLSLKPADHFEGGAQLDDGTLDLALGAFGAFSAAASWQRVQPLFEDGFFCVFDPCRVRAQVPIALDVYAALPHVLTSFRGSFSGVVDEVLAAQGLARRVVLVTSRFATLPSVLVAAEAVATLPATVAFMLAGQLGLAVSPLPLVVAPIPISMSWHARSHDDPGHAWLRGLVAEVMAAAVARVTHSAPSRQSTVPKRSRPRKL